MAAIAAREPRVTTVSDSAAAEEFPAGVGG